MFGRSAAAAASPVLPPMFARSDAPPTQLTPHHPPSTRLYPPNSHPAAPTTSPTTTLPPIRPHHISTNPPSHPSAPTTSPPTHPPTLLPPHPPAPPPPAGKFFLVQFPQAAQLLLPLDPIIRLYFSFPLAGLIVFFAIYLVSTSLLVLRTQADASAGCTVSGGGTCPRVVCPRVVASVACMCW